MTGQQDPLRKCPRGAIDLLATVEEEGSMVSHLQARMLAPLGTWPPSFLWISSMTSMGFLNGFP